jgi:hypothetical protein
MATLKASIEILESNGDISKYILNALLPQVNTYFENVFDKVSKQIEEIVITSIKNAPEYSSLISGNLKAEFGLPDSESRVNNIIEFWKNIRVKYNTVKIKNNSTLSGSFILTMIPSDYSDVINLPSANFTTEKGSKLNWLEWLLLFGNQTIIKDYEIKLGPNPNSRTGLAVMKGTIAGKWSVPPEFAGIENNNWITRAIDNVESDINKLLKNSLRK